MRGQMIKARFAACSADGLCAAPDAKLRAWNSCPGLGDAISSAAAFTS